MANTPVIFSVLSAGAARPLLEKAAPAIAARQGVELTLEFAPVGVVLEWLRKGRPADLVVLSREAMEAAWPGAVKLPRKPLSLGETSTVFLHRAGDPVGPLDTKERLRAALLASPLLLMPDLKRSTGGRHIAQVFARLGIAEAIAPRMQEIAAGGLAGAQALAEQDLPGALSCAQEVEVAHMDSVVSAGMPEEFALRTEYCIAATTAAAETIAQALAAASRAGVSGFSHPHSKEQLP